MNFEIVELNELSNSKCTIYSIKIEGEETSLYEKFLEEYNENYEEEVSEIYDRIKLFATKIGARESFFKPKEGNLGDGVCALYDMENSNLRLYCIRNGSIMLILGGGGFKSKEIREYQKDPILDYQAGIVKKVSAKISQRLKDSEIWYSKDGYYLLGNLKFDDDEY